MAVKTAQGEREHQENPAVPACHMGVCLASHPLIPVRLEPALLGCVGGIVTEVRADTSNKEKIKE